MLMQNPFHPLAPPDDPTLFFGRREALAFLRQHLVGAHNTHAMLIFGRLGMAKRLCYIKRLFWWMNATFASMCR
ncbi:MAG: hypothetical protein HC915_02315 [Anaerolineae bacterium]|nr:hypothetical protein [Anaerolineae bacterium]